MKEKDKVRYCGFCCQEIYLDREDYCKHEDYQGRKFVCVAYYHNKCFHDMLNKMKEKFLRDVVKITPAIVEQVKQAM